MEGLCERPPDYTAHTPNSIVLPSVPTTDPPLNSPVKLPDIKSLHLPNTATRPAPLNLPAHQQWVASPSQQKGGLRLPPPTPNFSSSFGPSPSPMETDSVISERRMRQHSIVSLDDPETREAAETLSGLRNMDFHRTPVGLGKSSLMALIRDDTSVSSPEVMIEDEQEPLLSLITSSHPWLGGTISGSLYAYNSTMHYSPQWIHSVVDKNLQSVASGLGSASRVTGLESRVRQYLGDTPERKTTRASNKRQRESMSDHMDVERGYVVSPTHSRQRSRTGSQASFDTLPAYDADRVAPKYEKQISVQPGSRAWSTRLVITTSGLGVALSEKSLKSLKYCLSLLRMATDRLAEIMHALRSLISDYEQTIFGSQAHRSGAQLTQDQEFASHAIADRIKSLGDRIMEILFEVTSNMSQYAGDALPENASALVRRQLMSVPQRMKLAEEKTSAPPSESTALGAGSSFSDVCEEQSSEGTMRTGQKWLVFAEQGCDMITQISLVVSGTVESAENWLDSMGRRRRESVMSEKTVMSIGAGAPS